MILLDGQRNDVTIYYCRIDGGEGDDDGNDHALKHVNNGCNTVNSTIFTPNELNKQTPRCSRIPFLSIHIIASCCCCCPSATFNEPIDLCALQGVFAVEPPPSQENPPKNNAEQHGFVLKTHIRRCHLHLRTFESYRDVSFSLSS